MTNSRYFTDAELACKHCGQNLMHADFLGRIDYLREAFGKPLVVTSAYRCPAHNKAVSSTGEHGPHTTGRAIDFGLRGSEALRLVRVALTLPHFTGIGVQQKGAGRFIHIDDLADGPGCPRPTIWSY